MKKILVLVSLICKFVHFDDYHLRTEPMWVT